MAKDERLFAKFSLDFADDPKIEPLSDAAFRTLIEMILYSRRLLTDGFIADGVARKRWRSKAISELMSNHTERPSLLRVDGGYQIRDYGEHQDTRDEVEARRRRNAENGRRGGLAKGKRVASKSLSKSDSESLSDSSSENVAETETEEDIEEANASSSSGIRAANRPDVDRLCELLANLIAENGSKRPTIGQGWRDAARLMLDRDKRPLGEAVGLIQWSQQHEFWRSNILSMPKFREQYDKLRLKRQGEAEKQASQDPWEGKRVISGGRVVD